MALDHKKHWLMFRCLFAGGFFVLDFFCIMAFIETMINGKLINIITMLGALIFLGYYSRNIYQDIKIEFEIFELTGGMK